MPVMMVSLEVSYCDMNTIPNQVAMHAIHKNIIPRKRRYFIALPDNAALMPYSTLTLYLLLSVGSVVDAGVTTNRLWRLQ